MCSRTIKTVRQMCSNIIMPVAVKQYYSYKYAQILSIGPATAVEFWSRPVVIVLFSSTNYLVYLRGPQHKWNKSEVNPSSTFAERCEFAFIRHLGYNLLYLAVMVLSFAQSTSWCQNINSHNINSHYVYSQYINFSKCQDINFHNINYQIKK